MEKEFTSLLHEHQGIVHKICNLYFGNRVHKEDYRQELIIQLWKAFPSFRNQSKFSTWMYRVCLNAAIDILRKEKVKPELIKMDQQFVSQIPEKDNENNDQKDLLYQLINQLSVIDKAIITLYLDEFSYKEIADVVGITESNAGVKINRIKQDLFKKLNNGN